MNCKKVTKTYKEEEMKQPSFSLEGELALVTGAARGIGQAIALGLAGAGADVAINDISGTGLEETAEELKKIGKNPLVIEADVSTWEGRGQIVKKTLTQFGRIDILINDAALPPLWTPVIETDEAGWDRIMNTDLKGLFFLSVAVAKEAMIPQKKGNIVNLASIASFKPAWGQGAYSFAKAGVWMLTQILASEWAKYGIRVNAIAPRLVKTKMTEIVWSDPEKLKSRVQTIALGRIAYPEDMVGAVIYFASQASEYVTGQTLLLDGGIGIG